MILLKLNESSASLRVVPLPPLLRGSATTSAATNESGRTFYFSMGGVNYGSGGSLSAISEAMGLYAACFSASKISITGPGAVYYGLPTSSLTALQCSAPFMVVPIDSYDSMRMGLFALPNVVHSAAGGLPTEGTGTGQISLSNGSVGLKAQTHSQATVGGADNLGRRTYSDLTVRIEGVDYSGLTIKGITNYANISNVTLHAGTHSNVTIQGVSNYANLPFTSIATSIWSTLRSNFTTPGSFGEYTYSQVTGTSTGTVKGVENYANISNVTLHAGTHSNVTIQGLSNYGNLPFTSIATSIWSTLRSNFTTPGSFGEHTWSKVTGISTGTVFGITDTSNFPSGSGATAGETARAVWANSGRTLDGVSIATIFADSRSIWSALRSAYTTPGSFGEYVYSQVTGTSTGTVQGVTRALNLSANGDKTGYSISGTKTTHDALNDIDGSEVTLHAGTHSGATVQGLSNWANISNVTLHAGTHSGATIQGISNWANISNVTLHPGTHSSVTIQGVSRVNSGVTLNADTHSGATIAGIVAGGIIASTLASGAITSAKFAAGAIDAVALATDAGQEIADRVLGRNIAGGSDGGRPVSEALYPLRNRSLIQGSVGTVYQVDDATSSWTFSPSLGTAPLSGIDPLGP
jgi:hypothetical protein